MRHAGAPPLRTVFLDLGDTLMHVHPDVPALYLRAIRELGVDTDAVTVGEALHAGERIYRDALRQRPDFESSITEARRFWTEYNRRILERCGATGDHATLDDMGRRLAERFWSPPSWRVFPDVHDTLATLRGAGLQLAVVSNFTDALVAVCETHDLDGYFDCLVASTTVGAQKPDVAIFREALRRTGADPAASIHVGDNYVADILGARAAGIDAVLLDRSRRGVAGMFDFTRRDGLGQTADVRLDCPVIGGLDELLTLVE